MEKPDIVDKYCRRLITHDNPELKDEYYWTDEEDRVTNVYITINSKYDHKQLPSTITLKDCQPGEVSIWKKRSFPKAARFHKKREDADPNRYFLSELMLDKGVIEE